MREIKFRIWNDYIKGYLTLKGERFYYEPLNEEHIELIATHKKYSIGGNSSVLEQYTGLKDKNGVEIYEGDVLKIKMEDDWQELPYIVESVLELGSFIRTEDVDRYYRVTDYYVIGNIHDKENKNE